MSDKSYSRRSANFTSCEIDFLIKIITKYRDIIENKKCDRFTAEEKSKVWKNVEQEYNDQFDYNFRSAKVLKTKYENLKNNAKKIIRQRDSGASFVKVDRAKPQKDLEEIVFMDETEFSTDKLLSDTVREYFEESFPENENTSSSWLAKEAEYAEDDTDDQGDLSDKDQDQSECKSRLLMPMYRKSSHSSTNNVATNNGVNESRLSDNVHASSLENTRNTTSRPVPVGKRQRNCLPSESIWESQPKKSSVYLFCDSLAMQIEEAQLTPRQLSSLQIDLLKTLQEYLPTDK